jgi:hypothetical protein
MVGPVSFVSSFSRGDDPRFNNQTLPQYLQNVMKRTWKGEVMLKRERVFLQVVLPEFRVSGCSSSAPSHPSRRIALPEPFSFFLRELYGDKKAAKTQICNSGFKLLERNLPGADEPITSSKGILSLNLLFHSMLRDHLPSRPR